MFLIVIGGVFILALCITIHELGHYFCGRLVGIKAEVFSFGYGKGIWKKKINDTTWQITAFPLGGYVKFYGDGDWQNTNFSNSKTNKTDKKPRKTKKNKHKGLYDLPPLKRIIPVLGGPFANLILGFLIFALLHSLSGPLSPEVQIDEGMAKDSPAYKYGLRNKDKIIAINDVEVQNFMGISQSIALNKDENLLFTVQRDEQELNIPVKATKHSSGIYYIGIRVPGEMYVQVNYPTVSLWNHSLVKLLQGKDYPLRLRAASYLKEGDIILSLDGQKISTIEDLSQILSQESKKNVTIKVRRSMIRAISPWPKEEITIKDVPINHIYKTTIIKKKNLSKIENPTKTTSSQSLENSQIQWVSFSMDDQKNLENYTIDGLAIPSFLQLYRNYPKATQTIIENKKNNEKFVATIKTEKVGLLGFQPKQFIVNKYEKKYPSFFNKIQAAWDDTTKNILVYPTFIKSLLTGKIAFLENTAGPVRIAGTASIVLQSGYQNYLYLFAAISIALGIMNLLPFPIVDGGHIVFFLYEAIAGRTLPRGFMQVINTLGFSILMGLGLLILFRDLLWLLQV